MNKLLIGAGVVGVGFFAYLAWCARKGEIAFPRIDPQLGVHRRLPYGEGDTATLRTPSAQDPKGAVADYRGYPYHSLPGQYAQGQWAGKNPAGPIGYSPLDYGDNPTRIPKLWKDATQSWDGLAQHGFVQQYETMQIRHLRPSYPTRGYRSISHAVTSTGPTASTRRIPAIFVPTSLA